jgi:hypothetical protein
VLALVADTCLLVPRPMDLVCWAVASPVIFSHPKPEKRIVRSHHQRTLTFLNEIHTPLLFSHIRIRLRACFFVQALSCC